jgi:hypothetical protein
MVIQKRTSHILLELDLARNRSHQAPAKTHDKKSAIKSTPPAAVASRASKAPVKKGVKKLAGAK